MPRANWGQNLKWVNCAVPFPEKEDLLDPHSSQISMTPLTNVFKWLPIIHCLPQMSFGIPTISWANGEDGWMKEHLEYVLQASQSAASCFPPPLTPGDFWRAFEGRHQGQLQPYRISVANHKVTLYAAWHFSGVQQMGFYWSKNCTKDSLLISKWCCVT